MSQSLDQQELLTQLAKICDASAPGDRHIIAIAGAPASGKSTLAEWLVDQLNEAGAGRAALLPMDGYHYDDRVLTPRGWQAQKGAPHTFDVGGLAAMLKRLRANSEQSIAVPMFDRSIEIARAGAVLIEQATRVIVVEGNYLLLDEAPWQQLAAQFDQTLMVEVDEAELERRLRERWVNLGLWDAEIDSKVDENDLPNGRLVYAKSRAPDIRIQSA
ncbi:MAG: nucleoside/nucleotide kinase family protein [Hyphomicrobiales bacterium]